MDYVIIVAGGKGLRMGSERRISTFRTCRGQEF